MNNFNHQLLGFAMYNMIKPEDLGVEAPEKDPCPVCDTTFDMNVFAWAFSSLGKAVKGLRAKRAQAEEACERPVACTCC